MGKTHFKKFQNPNYLGSWAFEEGQKITATIKSYELEKVIGENGKTDERPVMHFEETTVKPLIMNSTNAKRMNKFCKSPYVEDWIGKKIILGVEKTPAYGDVVDAVRIKSLASSDNADKSKNGTSVTKLMCEECGAEITSGFGMSADGLAKYTKEKYGKVLCGDCAKKSANK